MSIVVEEVDPFTRALGDQLRKARKQHRWTRANLVAELFKQFKVDISSQTIGTYELGTRQLSVQRLRQLTQLLGISMLDLLAEVEAKVARPIPAGQVTIALRAATALPGEHLKPLRAWADSRLKADPGLPTVRLGVEAQTHLADLCDLTPDELIEALLPALET